MKISQPIAHRGLHNGKMDIKNFASANTLAIENSATAFILAMQHGFAIECDLQKCKDGIAIFHDEKVDRLTKWQGKVIDYTIEELAGMQLGTTKDCINDLEWHLIQVNAKTPLILEIKTANEDKENYIKQLADILQNYKGEAHLMSFDLEIMQHCKKLLPNRVCGLVCDMPISQAHAIIEIMEKNQLDFLAYDIQQLPNVATETMRKINKPVFTWTVTNEKQAAHATKHADQIIFENFIPNEK